jgi:hypothetical protein
MYSEGQHEETLKLIRNRIWDTLPQFNELLKEIEIEPIAERREHKEFEAFSVDEAMNSGESGLENCEDRADDKDGSSS